MRLPFLWPTIAIRRKTLSVLGPHDDRQLWPSFNDSVNQFFFSSPPPLSGVEVRGSKRRTVFLRSPALSLTTVSPSLVGALSITS